VADDPLRNLLALVLVLVPLSLLSIGGGAAILADLEYQSVTVWHWTSRREFADLFALSRAAPGPSSMLAAMVGWKVAGWAGALTATAALYAPSALVAYGVLRLWGRWRGNAWHSAVEHGLTPIAAGLILSGGIAVLRVSPGGSAVWVTAFLSTAMLLRWSALNPLILFAVSGALFALGAALLP